MFWASKVDFSHVRKYSSPVADTCFRVYFVAGRSSKKKKKKKVRVLDRTRTRFYNIIIVAGPPTPILTELSYETATACRPNHSAVGNGSSNSRDLRRTDWFLWRISFRNRHPGRMFFNGPKRISKPENSKGID